MKLNLMFFRAAVTLGFQFSQCPYMLFALAATEESFNEPFEVS